MPDVTRARAKRWFAREFPGLRIERIAGRVAYVSHHPNFLCARYCGWAFLNARHPRAREAAARIEANG